MTEGFDNAAAVEAKAAAWLARQDGAGLTAQEQQAFDAWIGQSTLHRVAYLRLRAAWDGADRVHAPEAVEETVPVVPRKVGHGGWKLAAGLVLACGLGALCMQPMRGGAEVRYATQIGENRTVALSDGSRITLNTDTRVSAPQGDTRRARLDSGEAYFDIAHDPAHPFVVEAGASRITVLGTRFSVRRDGGRTHVLVAQGHVRVSEQGRTVDLWPNQEATASGSAITRAQTSAVETEQQLAWRDGRLVFDKTTLAQAAAEFNRYNRRKLVIADAGVAAIDIGGSFAPTNLDGFVRLLEQGFALRAERDGDRIVLSR